MLAAFLENFPYLRHVLSSPFALALAVFQVWMMVDAIRRQEWLWLVFLVLFPGIATFFYFFSVYRGGDLSTRGFELPGAHSRQRIRELQAQIHLLDKPHHHLALADIYFQQGKYGLAETHYRASLERDPADRDTRAHLGQCLLRTRQAPEALPLLEGVIHEDPRHDYGYTLMALAEAYTALGQTEAAIRTWERVLEGHSYARARTQLAELYHARGETEKAREQVREVIESDPHAPGFDRKRNRVWVRRARRLGAKL
jgi:hypothetical protein